ncbi:unnamed protein product (mitochondrion) [Sympodiomycopsis kandeliae]
MFFCPKYITIDMCVYISIVFILVILKNFSYAKRLPANARTGPHNKIILEIIYGSLLGDSYAERRILGNGTRICFYQEAIHKEYLIWLHSIIINIGYCSQTIPKIQTRLCKKGKIRLIMRFKTFTYQSLDWIHDNWYDNGIKRVPRDIKAYLSPLALAIWIIDDGSRSGKGLKFRINSFTYDDCLFLSNVLLELYNVRTSVQKAGYANQYVIYVFAESIDILRHIVKPYIVNSMLYKLG